MAWYLRSVPDWARRGIRLFVLLFAAGLGGHGLYYPSGLGNQYRDEFRGACMLAGVTAIFTNAPLIGRLVLSCSERILGTIAGGFLGFVAYHIHYSHKLQGDIDLTLAFIAACAGGGSVFAGHALGLDMTPRFFAMTFLLATNQQRSNLYEAMVVAILRTLAVIVGVLGIELLTILILPRSATIESFRDIRRALKALAHLNTLVWTASDLTAPHTNNIQGVNAASGDPHSPPGAMTAEERAEAVARAQAVIDALGWKPVAGGDLLQPLLPWGDRTGHDGLPAPALLLDPLQVQADESEAAAKLKRANECEKQLTLLYTSLSTCDENLKLAAGEVYLWHFWGHYIFLPGVPTLGRLYQSRPYKSAFARWRLQAPLVSAVVRSIRRLGRLLWNVQLSLAEELTPDVKAAVQSKYPAGLLPEVAQLMGQCIDHLLDAFPGSKSGVNMEALHQLGNALRRLQEASDEQHRLLVKRLTEGQSGRHLAARSVIRRSHMGNPDPAPATRYPHILPTVPESSQPSSHTHSAAGTPPSPRSHTLTGYQPPVFGSPYHQLDPGHLPEHPSAPPLPAPGSSPPPHSYVYPVVPYYPSAVLRNRFTMTPQPPPAAEQDTSDTVGSAPGQPRGIFPPTTEGAIARVRWASFEWLVDQLGDELEELFMAAQALMSSLPYPV